MRFLTGGTSSGLVRGRSGDEAGVVGGHGLVERVGYHRVERLVGGAWVMGCGKQIVE